MSQAFFRCPLCHLPHSAGETVCPTLGKQVDLEASSRRASLPPPPLEKPTTSSKPPPDPADRRNLLGETVDGKYFVRGVIGAGGMAIVYEAEHVAMGRVAALKVLPSELAESREASHRFLQEARAAASLSHPNICAVFDFGTLPDGSPYYVMERLVGEPLGERLSREGAMGFLDVVEICLQLLAGLGAAHKAGILHRDVKPDNVFLVSRDARPPLVKILDFGVAKRIRPPGSSGEDTTQLTRAGQVMGTSYYLAPEQAFGDRDLDVRVDLWATGVILYEAIAGRRPFVGTSYLQIANAILTDTPKPLAEIRPGTPDVVQRVVDKALAKNRDDRYPNAVAMMRDLHRVRIELYKLGLVPEVPRSQKI